MGTEMGVGVGGGFDGVCDSEAQPQYECHPSF
jgi:hypothetical protein